MPKLKIMGTYLITEPDGTKSELRICRYTISNINIKASSSWVLESVKDGCVKILIAGISQGGAEVLHRALRGATKDQEAT